VDPRADLLGQRAAFKTKLPHLAGGGAYQTKLQLKDNNYWLVKTTALTTLHDLANLPRLTISIKLVDRRTIH
jgi:hypothetical protein